MATADTVLVETYRICRDPSRSATSEAIALKFISHAQRALNTYTRSHVSEVTLSTAAGIALYAAPTTLSRIDLVREGNKDLVKFRLSQLWARDKNWLVTQGTQFIIWSRIGRQVLAVVPPKATTSAVTLVGPTNLADLTTIGATLSVRDDQLETLAEMTEALFTLRLRLFPAFQAVMERLGQKFSIAPTKLFLPGVQSVDSSERAVGVAAGDIPDVDERMRQVAQQRGAPGGGQIA